MSEKAKAFALALAHKALALRELKRETVAGYLLEAVFTEDLAKALDLDHVNDFWYCDWAEWYTKFGELVPKQISEDFYFLFESGDLKDLEALVKPLDPPVLNGAWLLSVSTPMESDELEGHLEKVVQKANHLVKAREAFLGERERFLDDTVERAMAPVITLALSRSAADVWGESDRLSKKQKS